MNIFNGNTKDFEEYARAGVVEGNYNERQLKYYNWLNDFNSRSLPAAIRSANKSKVAEVFNLFANGEQGAWYDPSDLSTLYQDSAGTTPVTADGDPVGLMLDKSQGLVLGSELVTNGTFNTNIDGWQDEAAVDSTWENGKLRSEIVDSVSGTSVKQSVTVEVGKSYIVTWEAENVLGAEPKIILGTPSQFNEYTVATDARRFIINETIDSTLVIYLSQPSASVGDVALFDNVSVKELPGNHATQSVAASRPVYRRGDHRGVVNLTKWSEDFSKAYWTKTNVTVQQDAVPGPYPDTLAAIITDDATSAAHNVKSSQPPAILGGQSYTLNAVVKADTLTHASVRIDTPNTGTNYAIFDLSTGVSTLQLGSALTDFWSVDLGNGWWEISITVQTDSADVTANPHVHVGNSLTYSGSGQSLYFYRIQLSRGTTTKDYQKNEGHIGGVALGGPSDLHWLESDGVDDAILIPSSVNIGTSNFTVSAAMLNLDTPGAGRALFSFGGNNASGGLWRITNEIAVRIAGGFEAYDQATDPNFAQVFTTSRSGPTAVEARLFLNGDELGVASFANLAADTLPGGAIFASNNSDGTVEGSWSTSLFYGLVGVVSSELSEVNRQVTEQYIAQKAGVTL